MLSVMFLTASSYSQGSTSSRRTYTDSTRITTTYSRIYVGPKYQKNVVFKFDTTNSVQTILLVDSPLATDTTIANYITVIRLNGHSSPLGYVHQTNSDTVRLKTLGGTVPVTIISTPVPLQ